MKHGAYKSPAYNSWGNMIQRCTNPKNTHYAEYGGRGITVCDRWKDFRNFLADMGERPEGMTLDRTDNNGHYSPNNCRWVSRKVQALNRRSNIMVEIDGVTKPVIEWLKQFGIHRNTFDHRYYVLGWPAIRALSEPTRKYNKLIKEGV